MDWRCSSHGRTPAKQAQGPRANKSLALGEFNQVVGNKVHIQKLMAFLYTRVSNFFNKYQIGPGVVVHICSQGPLGRWRQENQGYRSAWAKVSKSLSEKKKN
jgi:hypothetical protein